MTYAEIHALILQIEGTSARLEKEALLEKLTLDPLGRFILRMTYDTFVTYGIKPSPPAFEDCAGKMPFSQVTIEPFLHQLAKRELTGRVAEREVYDVTCRLDHPGADLLYRILSKDLKCGIAETTINTVSPGLIPVFAVMRAHPYEEHRIKSWPQKGEFKLDGQRNTFLCRNGFGGFFTRSGKRVPALDFLVPVVVDAAQKVRETTTVLDHVLVDENGGLSFMLDGEAMMGLFEETGALRRKDQDALGAELHLYDMMSYADFDAKGSVGEVLAERRRNLTQFVKLAKELLPEAHCEAIQIVPQYFLMNHKDVEEFFDLARRKTLASYLARGDAAREAALLKTTIDRATGQPKVLEGIMVKNPEGLYDKKKSYGWMKVKPEETLDLRIIGYFPGEPGTKYQDCLGGLVVRHKDVNVRVGGGFTDLERQEFWEIITREMKRLDEALINHEKDAIVAPSAFLNDTEILFNLAEIEFHEETPDRSLRHPRFVRLRGDKRDEVEDKEKVA